MRGKVVDTAGQPLTAFTLKVRESRWDSLVFGTVVLQKVVDDSQDGSFELESVPDGHFVIEGLAPGYASSFSPAFDTTAGRTTSEILVSMTRGGSLAGQVTDLYEKKPVAGAEITTRTSEWVDADTFELFSALEPSALTQAHVQTDAAGRFRIDLVTPGNYEVQVRANGFVTSWFNPVTILDGQINELPQQLLHGATISGLVLRGSEVVSGAWVQLSPADSNQMHGGRTARADDAGRYAIENVLPGSYELSATRSNPQSGNPFETIGDMRQSQLEISLADGEDAHRDLHMSAPRAR